MKILLLFFIILLVVSCDIDITSPYCPVSDSAIAKADSIPLGCDLPKLPGDSL